MSESIIFLFVWDFFPGPAKDKANPAHSLTQAIKKTYWISYSDFPSHVAHSLYVLFSITDSNLQVILVSYKKMIYIKLFIIPKYISIVQNHFSCECVRCLLCESTLLSCVCVCLTRNTEQRERAVPPPLLPLCCWLIVTAPESAGCLHYSLTHLPLLTGSVSSAPGLGRLWGLCWSVGSVLGRPCRP